MDDRTFIEWDKDDLDALDMMKVDVLALGMLTCIRKAFDLIADHKGERYELATIPSQDDARSTTCCARRVARRVPGRKPRADEHAAAAAAADILRSRHRSRDRAAGSDPGRHGASLSEAPAEMHGRGRISSPSRQAATRMNSSRRAAQDPRRAAVPGTGDAARHRGRQNLPSEKPTACAARWRRSAMSAPSANFEDKMVDGMIGRGYDPEFAKNCFEQIKGFGSYGFPGKPCRQLRAAGLCLGLAQMLSSRRVLLRRC